MLNQLEAEEYRRMRSLTCGSPFAAISRRVRRRLDHFWKMLCRKRLERHTISKKEFISDVRTAVESGRGYAAGKMGVSQQHWIYYHILRQQEADTEKLHAFEQQLRNHAFKTGLFPPDPSICLEYNTFYMDHLKNLNCLGLCLNPWDFKIIKYYGLKSKLVFYPDQEPDRSLPDRQDNCYLQYFRNKRLLIICPFAKLLQQRATKEIFEGVWSNTGKKWFYPKDVEYVEFPYGFSAETQKQFPTVLDLFKYITTKIERTQFDIALVAAGALAVPIASHVKNLGRVGIDLGGHLQVLFGVAGKRWRVQQFHSWKVYFNDYWIEMPAHYRPKEVDAGLRDSSYW